jgi:glutamate dehydrogenase (NAD(P)+)
MSEAFRFCDELGPARVLHVFAPGFGLRAIVVVDSVAAGPRDRRRAPRRGREP